MNCSSLTIYCEAESQPDNWDLNWNPDNQPVVWGYKIGTAATESAATAINIYAYGNTIVVENATDEIRVYNAMGSLVATANNENAEIRINGAGVYIVRTGNIAKRVMVN